MELKLIDKLLQAADGFLGPYLESFIRQHHTAQEHKCSLKHREQSLNTIVMKAEHAACGRPEASQGFKESCLKTTGLEIAGSRRKG